MMPLSTDSSVPEKTRHNTVASRIGNETSSTGYALGYGAADLMMIFAIPLMMLVTRDIKVDILGIVLKVNGLRIVIFICGVWWFTFSLITFKWLKVRPSPATLSDKSPLDVLSIGWRSTFNTIRDTMEYPDTLRFMILYFFFSDSYSS